MSYINTGATVNGRRPASKAQLKRAVAADPGTVRFDTTGTAGPRAGDTITCDAADIGAHSLSVTGPDPYRNRQWYATVRVSSSGKVQVL